MSGSIISSGSPQFERFSKERNSLTKLTARKLSISVLNDYQGSNPGARILSIRLGKCELVHERLPPQAVAALVDLLTKPINAFAPSLVEPLDDDLNPTQAAS